MQDINIVGIVSSVLLVLVTLGLVIYTSKLWSSTERLVKSAEDTAERQLRAYVAIVNGGMRWVSLKTGGRGLAIHIELKNSGQTPAYKFSTWLKKPEIREINAVPFGPPTPINERPNASIIGPGASVHLNWTIEVEDTEADAIVQGEKQIFVWGGADYVDSFGKTRYFVFRDVNGVNTSDQQVALTPHRLGYEAN